MASELKIASAFFFDSRSPISSSFDSGRPKTTARRARAAGRGRCAARWPPRLATSWPGPGVAEIRRVRPLDADAPVRRLAALQWAAVLRSRDGGACAYASPWFFTG